MKMMKPSTQLLKLLMTPAQVANSLDWKKATSAALSTRVATLHIGQDRIGIAIGSHPALGQHVRTIQPPIELNLITKKQPIHADDVANRNEEEERNNQDQEKQRRRALCPSTIEELRDLCDYYNVGSFLVWWPLQPEGRPGARCGKVLHTLESLIEYEQEQDGAASNANATTNGRETSNRSKSRSSILSKRRPIALWTGNQNIDNHRKYAEDEWGRSSVYSRGCVHNKRIHRASTEQYCHPRGSSACAVETWDEFCKQYWPDTVAAASSQQHQHQQHDYYQRENENPDTAGKSRHTTTNNNHSSSNNCGRDDDDDDDDINSLVSPGGDITRSQQIPSHTTIRGSSKRMAA